MIARRGLYDQDPFTFVTKTLLPWGKARADPRDAAPTDMGLFPLTHACLGRHGPVCLYPAEQSLDAAPAPSS